MLICLYLVANLPKKEVDPENFKAAFMSGVWFEKNVNYFPRWYLTGIIIYIAIDMIILFTSRGWCKSEPTIPDIILCVRQLTENWLYLTWYNHMQGREYQVTIVIMIPTRYCEVVIHRAVVYADYGSVLCKGSMWLYRYYHFACMSEWQPSRMMIPRCSYWCKIIIHI
jgi:hypothetical protein